MTIQESYSLATKKLIKYNIPNINLDIDILLSHIIKKDRAYLYAYPHHKLTTYQLKKFITFITRRSKGEPIAYIVRHKEFYNIDFIVNKNTLIPRPETELLVEEILKNKNIKTIADIGTGCGTIAITLTKNNPKLKIYASDISPKAINIAKKNSTLQKTNKHIIFKTCDLLSAYKNIRLDCVVANLPYLNIKYKKKLNNNITIGLKYEPDIALYAGRDGLATYIQLFKQISKLKHTPKYLYCEIGHTQPQLIQKIIQQYLPLSNITTKKDLAGLNRLVIIKLSQD